MSACEKCWADAHLRAATRGGTVAEHYQALLEERKDNPCSAEEQVVYHGEPDPVEVPPEDAPGHPIQPQTPDQAAEAGNPFTPAEQRAHDALMARVTEAIYIQAAATTKATNIPPEMLPRLIVCAAVHGVQKAIESYQRREDQHHVIPFTREHRHDFQQRIIEDCTELQEAMGEAIDNLKATVASMKPMPTLVQ